MATHCAPWLSAVGSARLPDYPCAGPKTSRLAPRIEVSESRKKPFNGGLCRLAGRKSKHLISFGGAFQPGSLKSAREINRRR
jgi:hypothetical protein